MVREQTGSKLPHITVLLSTVPETIGSNTPTIPTRSCLIIFFVSFGSTKCAKHCLLFIFVDCLQALETIPCGKMDGFVGEKSGLKNAKVGLKVCLGEFRVFKSC